MSWRWLGKKKKKHCTDQRGQARTQLLLKCCARALGRVSSHKNTKTESQGDRDPWVSPCRLASCCVHHDSIKAWAALVSVSHVWWYNLERELHTLWLVYIVKRCWITVFLFKLLCKFKKSYFSTGSEIQSSLWALIFKTHMYNLRHKIISILEQTKKKKTILLL